MWKLSLPNKRTIDLHPSMKNKWIDPSLLPWELWPNIKRGGVPVGTGRSRLNDDLKSWVELARSSLLFKITSLWPVVALLGQKETEGSLQFTGLRCLAALRQSSLTLAAEGVISPIKIIVDIGTEWDEASHLQIIRVQGCWFRARTDRRRDSRHFYNF